MGLSLILIKSPCWNFLCTLKQLLLCWCFTAIWHFSGIFGCSPHCFWASLLGSLPVLSAHSLASNWQLPFLNQRKGENDHRNYFMTKLHERMHTRWTRIWPSYCDRHMLKQSNVIFMLKKYEPYHEKTYLQGFRPGKIQTGLLSYRDKLESWNFGSSK